MRIFLEIPEKEAKKLGDKAAIIQAGTEMINAVEVNVEELSDSEINRATEEYLTEKRIAVERPFFAAIYKDGIGYFMKKILKGLKK